MYCASSSWKLRQAKPSPGKSSSVPKLAWKPSGSLWGSMASLSSPVGSSGHPPKSRASDASPCTAPRPASTDSRRCDDALHCARSAASSALAPASAARVALRSRISAAESHRWIRGADAGRCTDSDAPEKR